MTTNLERLRTMAGQILALALYPDSQLLQGQRELCYIQPCFQAPNNAHVKEESLHGFSHMHMHKSCLVYG